LSTEKVANPTFVDRLLRLISEQAKGKWTIFAKKAGIPHPTFYAYVEGRLPNADNLIRIRDTFGVNINWLLTGQGDPYTPEEFGKVAEPAHLYGVPEDQIEGAGLSGAEQAELEAVLELAKQVLTSNNRQAADALERNIRYFAHAIKVEGRLSDLEEKVSGLETYLKKKGILMGGSPEDWAI
jgi:hypothetical protein